MGRAMPAVIPECASLLPGGQVLRFGARGAPYALSFARICAKISRWRSWSPAKRSTT